MSLDESLKQSHDQDTRSQAEANRWNNITESKIQQLNTCLSQISIHEKAMSLEVEEMKRFREEMMVSLAALREESIPLLQKHLT